MTAKYGRCRKDLNQDEIVRQCRKVGMLVVKFSEFRGHVFDLLIGHKGIWLVFEIKKSEKEKLKESELEFWEKCSVRSLPLIHATCFKDILIGFERELNK
jgi:hypothetical protein